MTESDAKLKWCCGPEGCGMEYGPDKDRYCVASQCMAWVWEKGAVLDEGKMIIVPERTGTCREAEGRCGLAK